MQRDTLFVFAKGLDGRLLFNQAALGKKMGLTVDSVRREDGERVYTIG